MGLTNEFSRVAVTNYRDIDIKTNVSYNNEQVIRTHHGNILHSQQQQNSWELTRNGKGLRIENLKSLQRKSRWDKQKERQSSKKNQNTSFQLFQIIHT